MSGRKKFTPQAQVRHYEIEIEYLHPALAGDTLSVTTWLEKMRGLSAIHLDKIKAS